MKYYQAVYQTDSHGFNIVYSKNIWVKEEHAHEYLYHLGEILNTQNGGYNKFPVMYLSWVQELFVDTPNDKA